MNPRRKLWLMVPAICTIGLLLWTKADRLALARFEQAASDSPSIRRENLAVGKPIKASTFQDHDKWAAAAVDGDLETRWCAQDGSSPQWLELDLGRPETLTGCRIVWEHDDAPYLYKVEGSTDGKTWSTLHDATRSTDLKQIRTHPFAASNTRFVRLTATEIADGHWASVIEFEVFGTKPAPAVAKNPEKKAEPKSVLKDVKLPAGFEASVFAAPPDVRYPTCLAATPSGEVFVGIDENGSLDAKGDRGRVVRCVDTDGDGSADKFNVFASMDSPRGLIWDAGTLFVLHPPSLTAYRDTDGDGVADKSEVLVEGIGFDLKHRGADHTTNGIRLAIDGFIYIAVGDYGFVKAKGRDGAPLQLLGGGVVRVRTDGTGLEIVSRGQRNIYDVAIDPKMNLFTRDNTNDGDGWDVRLSHVVPTGNYGYPSLFKRFGDEILQPLADYGGGSPCGSIFLQEPGFPSGYGDTLYTCEWGRGGVFMHPLQANGAGFKAGQEPFVTIPRPTDIDVDGSGRIFISSWRDGGYTYSKPDVGYVIRVVASDLKPSSFPDLAKANIAALVNGIGSDSSVMRLASQRELLRRTLDAEAARLLEASATSPKSAVAGRIAAVFTLAQALGPKADDFLIGLARSTPELREFAIKALADRRGVAEKEPKVNPLITSSLTDPNPRVRLAAVVASGRLGILAAAPTLLALTADFDPIVSHTAIQALVAVHAVDACLFALADATQALGASRALQAMHDPKAVDGLVQAAGGSRGLAARQPALRALCRLYFAEAPYEQGQWWGTRPDTSGPYYKPVTWSESEAVAKGLRAALKDSDQPSARWLLNEMMRNKVDLEETTPMAAKLALEDPPLRASVVDLMVSRPKLSFDAIRFLESTANDPTGDGALRAKATRGLLRRQNQVEAREAGLRALAFGEAEENPNADLLGVWNEYAKDNRHLRDLGSFAKSAEGPDVGRSTLAYAVLIAASSNNRAPEAARNEANRAINRAWDRPELAPRLLRAVGLAKAAGFAPKVQAMLDDGRTDIRQAAEFAAKRLNLAPKSDEKVATSAKPAKGPKPIAATAYEVVLAATLADKGDPALGTQLFERQGCVNCHAVSKAGPLKGPYLGDVAARYNRSELVESILKPSARIAQGFETQKIALNSGQIVEGFVVREAGNEVELRNSSGNVLVISKAEIDERTKGELSVMPQGLMDPLTPHDLASLLAYFESIKGK